MCESGPHYCSNLPAGCTCSGSILTSCAGFTGGMLSLDNVGITAIAHGAFNGLSSVTYLSLSHNSLTALPLSTFAGLPALGTLYVRNNNIGYIVNGSFHDLSSVTYL